ncbi:DNA replication/repair protein RecF [Chakrabartyella piscis]|uniref:DNA replication/repair protein RecF n=1 Tax=Chakrabartyella piscis TaxID=2918914 RepID=UPI0029587442|nr:DNA replication/repair protein RecF [Chakrabartyella piscis]
MNIKELSLQNFRNLGELQLRPTAGVNVFYGNNAQGKTNLLESLYFCGTGRSMRTKNDSQLIAFGKEDSHIRLQLSTQNRSERIDVHLKRDTKKGIAINGLPIRKLGDLFGTMYTVIFSPEDLSLVKDGPTERRRFLDMEICQISKVYYYDLQQYYRILKQRNHLLKEIQKKPALKEQLFIWDEQLVDYGERIISAREVFLTRLDEIAANKTNELTGGSDSLKIRYQKNCNIGEFQEKLKRNMDRDIYLGNTQSGPHKDDILFTISDKEVKLFGSQGQQRTTALAVKLAEIDLIQEETGESPILLLDDVLSELDEHRQRYLLESIAGLQSFITCTGVEDSIRQYTHEDNLFYVEDGKLMKSEK